jgi:plastocyanin
VKFAGAAPKPGRIDVTKDTAVCGAHPIVHEEMLVGADGGLENVVVSIQGAPAGGGPGKYTTELRQTGCVYHPHVSVVAAGQPLAVFNDDGILHNIHTFSTLNPVFNKAQPKFQKRIEVKFDKPETIKVICDAHPWMSAWVVVTDHPYVAVSDAGGAFRIDGLPAGTYTARLWHEKLGERSQPVEVHAGQTSDLSVEFR